jgi:3-deoxy-D-manno-octulosonate 8-phosphate phosphatase KdsC-like HAD superfamily phosphatase
VTKLPGGHGSVRETIEFVLQNKGLWDGMIRKYAN